MDDTKVEYYQNQLEEALDLDEHGFPDKAIEKARSLAEEAAAAGDTGYQMFFQGEALCLQGKLKAGLKLESEALGLLGNIPFVQINYGVLLSIQGHAKKALTHLEAVLNVEPDNLHALAQKGVCLAKLSQFEDALQCFNKILEVDPENLHALRNKGVCLSNLYHEDEAMEHFERVLSIDPKDSHARSEKKILKDELEMRGTPFGWLAYKIRKSLLPRIRAWKMKIFE